jgi:hypothetical protein
MGLPFWGGVFGAVVAVIFLVRAFAELKRNVPGHSRNAAMIHFPMASMLLVSCLAIIAFNL